MAKAPKEKYLFVKIYLVITVTIFLLLIIGSIIYVNLELSVMRNNRIRPLDLNLIAQQRQLTDKDISAIRYWMTFDYLNKVFALPTDYLKTSLAITNPHYPRLSIIDLARSQHQDVNNVLSQVQTAIYYYLTQPK